MKAIIVTHPNHSDWKACLFGIEFNKLKLLVELRAKNKGTIKSRYIVIEYENEIDLCKKIDSKRIGMYKITPETYKIEVQTYFELN
jgi:hypothetical protein